MRIGILTLPLHTNYGGILQAYALQTVLERMGHQVDVFNKVLKKEKLPWWKKPFSYTKRFIKKFLLKDKNTFVFLEEEWYNSLSEQRKLTNIFINKNIHQRLINSFGEIHNGDYDAIIVGSDQVWRNSMFHTWGHVKDEDAYLGFTKGWNIIRISYAASFGTNSIEVAPENLQSCSQAIARFKAVSIREESGISICKDFLNSNAVWMPDPTLLLTENDYKRLFNQSITSYHNLLSYVLDVTEDKQSLVNKLSKERNLEVRNMNKVGTWHIGMKAEPQRPVDEWLKAFFEADYVVTDSFHACVFSILFHKQFTVIANKERGLDRFTTLLDIFGLKDRLIYSSDEYKKLPDIDYAKIDIKVNEVRNRGYNFLDLNLN